MKRYNRFKMLNNIQDEYILESMPDYAGLQTKKRRENSPLIRFFNSGWGAACVCALVAVGVMIFIIRGAWDPIDPPVVYPPEETTQAVDPATETESEAPANETEAPTDPLFEEETDPVILSPDIAAKDYGVEFDIYYAPENKQTENVWFENTAEGVINPALYDAVTQTEAQLGVDVNFWNSSLSEINIIMDTEPAGAIDLFLLNTQGAISMLRRGFLIPFDDIATVNLDAAYWDMTLMDELSVNGRRYLGQNHFIPDDFYLLGYNKTLLSTLAPDFNAYETVLNRTWTYEKLLSLMSTTQGMQDDWGNAYVGLSMSEYVPHHLMLTGSDVHVVEKDEEGKFIYTFAEHMETLTRVVKDTKEFMSSEYVTVWKLNSEDQSFGDRDGSINLSQGYVLFQQVNVTELSQVRQMKYLPSIGQDKEIDLGVMPTPLYDTEKTQYTAYRTDAFLAIPYNTVDADMTGEVMELLAYHGTAAKTAYYTDMLGKTPEEAPEDHKILQMLSRHLTCNLWDYPTGLHSAFYGATLMDAWKWDSFVNTYRRTFENAYREMTEKSNL